MRRWAESALPPVRCTYEKASGQGAGQYGPQLRAVQHRGQLGGPPQRLCGHWDHRPFHGPAAQFTGVNYALIYYGLALAILLCTALTLGWREVSNILVLSLLYPVVLWGLNHIQVEIILQEKLIAVMLFGAIYGLGSGLTYRLATPTAERTLWPSC